MKRATEIIKEIPEYKGKDLRQIREDNYLKTQEMADLLEVTRVTLWRMEKEKRNEVLPLFIRSILYTVEQNKKPLNQIDYSDFQRYFQQFAEAS